MCVNEGARFYSNRISHFITSGLPWRQLRRELPVKKYRIGITSISIFHRSQDRFGFGTNWPGIETTLYRKESYNFLNDSNAQRQLYRPEVADRRLVFLLQQQPEEIICKSCHCLTSAANRQFRHIQQVLYIVQYWTGNWVEIEQHVQNYTYVAHMTIHFQTRRHTTHVFARRTWHHFLDAPHYIFPRWASARS